MAPLASLFVEFRASTSKFADDLAGVSKQVKELDKILKPIKGLAEDVGKGLTAGITVPLSALGAVAVGAAVKVDAAMDDIRAATGATGDRFKQLGDAFNTALGAVPNSVDQVSKAISTLGQRTQLAGKPFEDLSIQFLNLSRLTKTDVAESITVTTRAFENWRIATEKQGDALDFFFKVGQRTGASISTLASNVTQFGGALRQMGFSFEQSVALIGKFEKEGVNVEGVLQGLQLSLRNLAKQGFSGDASQALQFFIDKIKSAGNAAQANEIAIKAFGKAGITMADAIRAGRLDLGDFVNELEHSPETINKAAEATLSFADKLDRLKNKTILAIEPLGKQLVDALEKLFPLFEKGLKVVLDLTTAFSNLPSGLQTVILAFAGIAAAIGPLLLIGVKLSGAFTTAFGIILKFGPILSFLGTAITTAIGLFADLGAAVALVGEAFAGGGIAAGFGALVGLTGPVGVAIAAITALAGAAFLVVKNWDSIKGPLIGIWTAIKNEAVNLWESVKGPLLDVWSSVKDGAAKAFDGLVRIFQDVRDAALKIWKDFGPGILTVLNAVGAGIKSVINDYVTIFTVGFTVIIGVVKMVLADLASIVMNAFRAIGSIIGGALEAVDGILKVFGGLITGNWSMIWDGLKNIVGGAWEAISGVVKAGVSIIVDALTNLLSFWAGVFSKLGDKVPGAGAALKALGSALDDASQRTSEFSASINKSVTTTQAFVGPIQDVAKATDAFVGPMQAAAKATSDTSKAAAAAGKPIADLNALLDPEAAKKYAAALASVREKLEGNAIETRALNQVLGEFTVRGNLSIATMQKLGEVAFVAAKALIEEGKALPPLIQQWSLFNIFLKNSAQLQQTEVQAGIELTAILTKMSFAFENDLAKAIDVATKKLNTFDDRLIELQQMRNINQIFGSPIEQLQQIQVPVPAQATFGISRVSKDLTDDAIRSAGELQKSAVETAAKIDAMARAGFNAAQIAQVLGGEISRASDTVRVFGKSLDPAVVALIKQGQAAVDSAKRAEEWQKVWTQAMAKVVEDTTKAFLTFGKTLFSGDFGKAFNQFGKDIGEAFAGGLLTTLSTKIQMEFQGMVEKLLKPIQDVIGKLFDKTIGTALDKVTNMLGTAFGKLVGVFSDKLGDAIVGVFADPGMIKNLTGAVSGAVGAGVQGATQTAAGTATQTAGQVAGTSATALVSAISGVAGAVGSIAGAFESARMEGTLNAIEYSTRVMHIMFLDWWGLDFRPFVDKLLNGVMLIGTNILTSIDYIGSLGQTSLAILDQLYSLGNVLIYGVEDVLRTINSSIWALIDTVKNTAKATLIPATAGPIPALQGGGYIETSGAAVVHQGEVVMPWDQIKEWMKQNGYTSSMQMPDMGGAGAVPNVEVNVNAPLNQVELNQEYVQKIDRRVVRDEITPELISHLTNGGDAVLGKLVQILKNSMQGVGARRLSRQ